MTKYSAAEVFSGRRWLSAGVFMLKISTLGPLKRVTEWILELLYYKKLFYKSKQTLRLIFSITKLQNVLKTTQTHREYPEIFEQNYTSWGTIKPN